MEAKRISLFMGHYGSGKSFSAVNFAYMLKEQNHNVSVYDLDIVNPYFRTVDAERELKKRGIERVKVVYSKELPQENGNFDEQTQKPVPASIAFVPSVAGLILAGEVIKDLTLQKQ